MLSFIIIMHAYMYVCMHDYMITAMTTADNRHCTVAGHHVLCLLVVLQ